MNAERLLAHYERIADAPDAIARLRRFILDLAVRGKLVPQDANDEPASKIVARTKAQRRLLEKAKRIKQPSLPYGPISVGQDFDLPHGWDRSTIAEMCELQTGATPDRTRQDYFGGDIPWLVSGDIKKGVIFECEGRITELGLNASNCKILPEGSVLIALNGQGKTRATVALLRMGAACNQSLVAIIPILTDCLSPEYLHLNLKSRYRAIRELTGKDERRGLNMRLISCFEIAIPPLADQHRIVAKVDELMALCDRLEAARAKREATRDRLAAASLARLNAPDPVTFHDDARFALDALPALTTRPDQIKQLRQTILNLAVRGKLVPQDPNDEPASELLKRIAKEKARLVKEGKAKRQDALPEVDLKQAPFELPGGWDWARFPEVGTFGRGKSKHRPRNDPALFKGGEHLMIQTGDVARSQGVIETYTSKYNDFGLSQSLKWPKGTLCITIAANIADSGILSFAACFPDSVVGFIPASMFQNARYFEYFVRTAKANLLEFAPATAQKNINLEILTQVLIPIPPLAEQHRIVAKVDALMALCDRLEASLTAAADTRRRLLNALLTEALAAAEIRKLEAAE